MLALTIRSQYVIDHISYQSNYASGLRIVDISSVTKKPDGSGVKEVGFFDVYPEDDDEPVNGKFGRSEKLWVLILTVLDFYGAWSSYVFKSGYILTNSIERGVFSLKWNGKRN